MGSVLCGKLRFWSVCYAYSPGNGLNKHGGARRGAGRPVKWTFELVFTVGQTCEVEWRRAEKAAFDARLSALPNTPQIRALHEGFRKIPVEQRRAWRQGDAYEDHSGDIEALIHARVKTPFDEETARFERVAPRLVTVSSQPFRGTRGRIITEVALLAGLNESVVDNLWQKFRRIEREPLEPQESSKT